MSCRVTSNIWRKKNFLSTLFRKTYSTEPAQCEEPKPAHTPVMAKEVLENLQPFENGVFIDMTFGAGGHSRKILESSPNIKLIALDRDPVAFTYAENLSKEYPNQVVPLLGRFSELPELLKSNHIKQNSIDGILFDFGCSSMQFDRPERGFSIWKNGPLDMRMDGNRFPDDPTAADILYRASEEELARIFKVYGEEKQAKKIARALIETRYMCRKIETTQELADVVNSVCGDVRFDKLKRRQHVATKTFQALRIFVNNELNEINYGMIIAQRYLKIGGRIVTVAFHSLEDTIVKRHLTGVVADNVATKLPLRYSDHLLCYSSECISNLIELNWKSLHKHVLTPTSEEIEENPRSRSAKLRAAVRIS